jgi:hypothetical protein
MDVGDVIPSLAGVCRAWGPLAFCGLESIAFQKQLVREANRHRDIPPVRELKPAGKGKLARAVSAIVKAENGEIYLPEDAPWVDALQTELGAFTGAGDEEDDQVDAISYATVAASSFRAPGSGAMPMIICEGRPDPFRRSYDVGSTRVGAQGYGAELAPGGGFFLDDDRLDWAHGWVRR